MRVRIHRFPASNCCNKKARIKSSCKQTKKLNVTSINQMVIRQGGKSHGAIKSDSHLSCKVANKCRNVREQVEVVEWNKRWSPPFPCMQSCELLVSVKENCDRKKKSQSFNTTCLSVSFFVLN